MKTLRLRNYHLIGTFEAPSLQAWLEGLKLYGPASRARTRFIRLLGDRIAEINNTRSELLEKHAARDKRKNIIYLVGEIDQKTKKLEMKETTDPTPAQNKRYKIKDDVLFNKEWNEYIQEGVMLDVTPSTSEIIYGTRDLVLSTEQEFSGHAAVLYDEWCEAFEAIKGSDSEKKDQDKNKD